MINFLKGDATDPKGDGNKIIVHICNDVGGWGRGFVLAISNRWKEPEASYREWYKAKNESNFALGQIQLVQVEDDIFVGNMIAQRDVRTINNIPPVRYDALESALNKVEIEAKKLTASVHMPRIGCGLAGGEWNKVEAIIQKTLVDKGVEVFVYDF